MKARFNLSLTLACAAGVHDACSDPHREDGRPFQFRGGSPWTRSTISTAGMRTNWATGTAIIPNARKSGTAGFLSSNRWSSSLSFSSFFWGCSPMSSSEDRQMTTTREPTSRGQRVCPVA